MRQRGFPLGQRRDVVGRVAQRAERLAFGERDRLVELLGLEHFGREDSELAAIQEQRAEVRVL